MIPLQTYIRLFSLVTLVCLLSSCTDSITNPQLLSKESLAELVSGASQEIELEIPAGLTVMVRIEGWGTEYNSTLKTQGQSTASVIKVPWIRNAPHIHVISKVSKPRSAMVRIDVVNSTKDSFITVKLFKLGDGNRLEKLRFEALENFALALNGDEDRFPAVDDIKKLNQAAILLDDVGEHELALWADFYSSFVSYWQLFDLATVINNLDQVLLNNELKNHPRLHLATMQLLGVSLVERIDEPAGIAKQKFMRGQKILSSAYQNAQAMGLPFEQMFAQTHSGNGYLYEGQYVAAIQQYELALGMATSLDDTWFRLAILGNHALAIEAMGKYSEAIELLLKINVELRLADEPGLLGDNLRELGRVHQKVSKYNEAISYLVEAKKSYVLANDQAGLGRVHSTLGIAYRSIGRMEQAHQQMLLARDLLHEKNAGNDLFAVYRTLADIARVQERLNDMVEYRQHQEKYLTPKATEANYWHDLSLDSLAQGDVHANIDQLGRCISISSASENNRMGELCNLERTLGFLKSGRTIDAATWSTTYESYQILTQQGLDMFSLRARYLMAQLRNLKGDVNAAKRLSAELISDMKFFRRQLPGMMGAWYWESRSEILQFYFDLLIENESDGPEGYMNNLLALDGLRSIEMQIEQIPQGEALRELVVLRDRTTDRNTRLEINNQIDAMRAKLVLSNRPEFLEAQSTVSPAEWLGKNEGYLTYHFGVDFAYGWLVTTDRIDQQIIRLPSGFIEQVDRAVEATRVVGAEEELSVLLDQIGNYLLSPFSENLPERIYFQPGGPLAGFPFDALRIDGKFLLESSEIIEIFSLQALRISRSGKPTAHIGSTMLVAGSASIQDSSLAELAGVTRELSALESSLPGVEINSLSGAALNVNRLLDALNNGPDIVHIASHANLDLEYPELSQLMLSSLSDAGDSSNRTFLTPADLNHIQLKGALVVLSACSTAGSRRFAFESGLGFVVDFLRQGASQVIASLWPVSDQVTADLMEEFYKQLGGGLPPSSALRAAKLSILRNSGNESVSTWSSFQVFINEVQKIKAPPGR